MKALINGKIIHNDGIHEDRVLLMDQKIKAIVDVPSFLQKEVDEIIDVKGHYISPGFIDIHIHGSGGCDTMDGSVDALKTISNRILTYGTTGFLPTTMSMDMQTIYTALDTVKEAMTIDLGGANILGVHLEGPFINKAYKGAQKEDTIIPPDYNLLKDYMDIIKIITMAPEIEGSKAFIQAFKQESNATLAIGHSAASYEEAMEAIQAGISHCTHIFNAMTPLHHRNPGVVGAAFNSFISCELIADKIHVHPELFKLLLKIKGEAQLVLVTDAIRGSCMKDGSYELGGQMVEVREGRAQLPDGRLAGSVLTLNKAIQNFVEVTNEPLYKVIKLASLNPAKVIGIDDRKGSIEVGKDADVIVFDEGLNVRMVFIEGSIRLGGSYDKPI
ncbi:N-acetylglucosamine-6-phosphate deacetylase [Alkaliphilus serpentinus]|uniref:N-acetylglucosamine-6-phosphate deacetylase n=1 Tax=Alkaliphilus serpentinus TaxID=1482731 RepID=A0A833HQB0_9FIRM|nr:N-acetylglucosamine-6-phosphate deacetylase [Alkaliphilus serpentinus]KAB3531583.1 N-acetylglucosamine-6-phosphate deacetylase [Alkaliphilus serpentinus]